MSNDIITTITLRYCYDQDTMTSKYINNTIRERLNIAKYCIIILVLDPPHLPKTITRIINWGRTPPPPHNVILERSLTSDKAHNIVVKIVINAGTLWQCESHIASFLVCCVSITSHYTLNTAGMGVIKAMEKLRNGQAQKHWNHFLANECNNCIAAHWMSNVTPLNSNNPCRAK